MHSTPPLSSSSIQDTNPPPGARSESVDSFSLQPAIGQPESGNLASNSPEPVGRFYCSLRGSRPGDRSALQIDRSDNVSDVAHRAIITGLLSINPVVEAPHSVIVGIHSPDDRAARAADEGFCGRSLHDVLLFTQ
jgi:hypothetical protein